MIRFLSCCVLVAGLLLMASSFAVAQDFFGTLRDKINEPLASTENAKPVVQVRQIPVNNKAELVIERETEDGESELISLPAPGEGEEVISEEDFNAYPSLFLKTWQRREIFDVRNFRGKVYEAYIAELRAQQKRDELEASLRNQEAEDERKERMKPPPDKRYIALQGIIYTAPDDWVVWMNGQKITPGALPAEVIGFKVYESYVEMKWFDEYTNKIIPVRLRPMQRFHIDTRMFLPG